VAIAETGVALFSAAETLMPEGTTFLGQMFYESIGYTVGATVGACLAAPGRRVVLFVGDGAFQVTGQELSTIIRYRLKPVIFLLNNDGYTIERVICDRPYNDIQPWKYHRLVDVFGSGLVFDVRTEGELEEALRQAETADSVVFIEVHTGRLDCLESLKRVGAAVARANQLDGVEPSADGKNPPTDHEAEAPGRPHAGAVPDARMNRLTGHTFRQETERRSPYHSP
jgi:indolepyruvate decarboxylase